MRARTLSNQHIIWRRTASQPLARTFATTTEHVYGRLLDNLYGRIAGRFRGALHFETGQWGDLNGAQKCLQKLQHASTEQLRALATVRVEWKDEWQRIGCGWQRDGTFESPLVALLGEEHFLRLFTKESRIVHFRYILPSHPPDTVSTCLHLPYQGDQGFQFREKNFAVPLAEKWGLGSVIIEGATYGLRRDAKKLARGAQNKLPCSTPPVTLTLTLLRCANAQRRRSTSSGGGNSAGVGCAAELARQQRCK